MKTFRLPQSAPTVATTERLLQDLLQERRAAYGAEILPTLSAKLMPEFGRGYSSYSFKCRHPPCPRLLGNAVPLGENEL